LISVLLAATSPLDVGQTIHETNHTFIRDGDALVALTSTHHVTVTQEGVLSLEGSQPVRFSVHSVRRDGASCETTALTREAMGRVVTTQRLCSLVETWTNLDEGLEQELILARAPMGKGPLRVRIDVRAPWHHADAQGHLFAGPGGEAMGVRYGNAFLVTHEGKRVAVPVTHEEGGLELVVPEALVDAPGAFPLHLDPLVRGSEQPVELLANVPNPPLTDELEVAAAAVNTTGQTDEALVVWVDRRRLLNTDLFGAVVQADGGIQTFPLMVAPLDQRQPTIVWSPALLRWVVAWQQINRRGVTDVGLCTVERPTVTTALTVTQLSDVPGRNAPSLAVDPSGNPLIALAQDGGLTISPLPTSGTVVPTLSLAAPNGATITKTVLATGDAQPALGLEYTVAGTSHVAFYAYDASSPNTPTLLAFSNSALAQRAPVARFFGGAAWFAYEQASSTGTGTDTVVFHNAVNETPRTIVGARSPSLVSTGVRLYLGTVNDTMMPMLNIENLAVLAGFTTAAVPIALSGEVNPSPLLLTPFSSQQLLAAWTSGLLNRDVKAALVTLANPPSSFITVGTRNGALAGTNPPQRSTRVAMQGNEGVVAWIEGTNAIRARRFSLSDAGVSLAPPTLISTGITSRLDAIDLSMEGGGGALVTWSDGVAGAPNAFVVAPGPLAPGHTVPMNVVAAGRAISLPVSAWDGTQYVLAWLSNNVASTGPLLNWTTVSASGVAGNIQNTPASGTDLHVACLNGKCVAVWTDPNQGVALKRLGNTNSPVKFPAPTGARPLVADDGSLFQLAWMTLGAFQFASYDEPANSFSTPTTQPYGMTVPTSAALAAGSPVTLAWSDNSTDPPTVMLSRGGEVVSGMQGFDVSVATAPGNRGVVVAGRWQTEAFDVVAYVNDFAWIPRDPPPDAGTDAGVAMDAGTGVDGGLNVDGGVFADAGVDGGVAELSDGGSGPISYDSRGCPNCSTSPSVLMVGIAFLLLRRRRG
jgi:hypothetical protein